MYALPTPGMEKLKSQVKVTFWFWLMYPPSRNWNWTKHECYRTNIISREIIKYILQSIPHSLLPEPLSDSMPEQETGEFQFQMNMDIWTWTPSTTPLQPKKWNAHFWITFDFWWLARLVDRLEPHLPPLSSQKNEMLIFGLSSTSDDWLGWSIDSNPICHPSPAKNMKCSFLDYIQLLMIDQAGRWTQNPSATPLQPKKWNVHFWITFNFWCLAGLVNGLKPHPPSLSSQKNEMLIFGLHSTSDDWLGRSMDMNSIHHPSAAKKMKCSFFVYVQCLMISWAGQWSRTPSATPLQPKKEMLIFVLHSTSDDWPCQSMDSNPICCPSPAKKWNAHYWITFNFWWSARLVNGLKPHLPPLSSQKNEMLIFGLHSTSHNQLGW